MAQSQSDGIGGVVRLGHFLKTQKPLGHIHHLMLGGIAVAHDGLLHLGGFIGETL